MSARTVQKLVLVTHRLPIQLCLVEEFAELGHGSILARVQEDIVELVEHLGLVNAHTVVCGVNNLSSWRLLHQAELALGQQALLLVHSSQVALDVRQEVREDARGKALDAHSLSHRFLE